MVVEIICGITGYRSMRFDGTLVEDLLQTVISSDCRLAFTTASEKKGASVTWAQAFSSAMVHMFSWKARCHH
jgi:hypothetical protein